MVDIQLPSTPPQAMPSREEGEHCSASNEELSCRTEEDPEPLVCNNRLHPKRREAAAGEGAEEKLTSKFRRIPAYAPTATARVCCTVLGFRSHLFFRHS